MILKDADQPSMRLAVAEFVERIEKAGPDAVAFLYYSGHGAADRTDRGENYLIPVGAKITLARQLPILSISLSEITKSLERVPAKARFVVVDACRDVAFTNGLKDAMKGFVPERKLDGMIVAFARFCVLVNATTRRLPSTKDNPSKSDGLTRDFRSPHQDFSSSLSPQRTCLSALAGSGSLRSSSMGARSRASFMRTIWRLSARHRFRVRRRGIVSGDRRSARGCEIAGLSYSRLHLRCSAGRSARASRITLSISDAGARFRHSSASSWRTMQSNRTIRRGAGPRAIR
jgi:hypothetical protein